MRKSEILRNKVRIERLLFTLEICFGVSDLLSDEDKQIMRQYWEQPNYVHPNIIGFSKFRLMEMINDFVDHLIDENDESVKKFIYRCLKRIEITLNVVGKYFDWVDKTGNKECHDLYTYLYKNLEEIYEVKYYCEKEPSLGDKTYINANAQTLKSLSFDKTLLNIKDSVIKETWTSLCQSGCFSKDIGYKYFRYFIFGGERPDEIKRLPINNVKRYGGMIVYLINEIRKLKTSLKLPKNYIEIISSWAIQNNGKIVSKESLSGNNNRCLENEDKKIIDQMFDDKYL